MAETHTLTPTLTPRGEGQSDFTAACDEEIVSLVRRCMREVTGGNCTFADEDLAVLTTLAKWALEHGVPDELSPNIIPRAKAWLAGGDMVRASTRPEASFVYKAANLAKEEQNNG